MPPELTRQVAFITGKILHQGTRLPIVGRVQITAREATIVSRVLNDGTFVISGSTTQLFPDLNSQSYRLTLNFHVDSLQFRLGSVQYTRSVTIPSGSNFDPDLPTTAPTPLINLGTLYLPVNPADDPTADPSVYQENLKVVIRGRVIQAEQPEVRFSSAPTVQILQSGVPTISVTTDANGRYEFSGVVVRSPARIRCSTAGFQDDERRLLVDYSKVFNQEIFQLLSIATP